MLKERRTEYCAKKKVGVVQYPQTNPENEGGGSTIPLKWAQSPERVKKFKP